MRDGDEELAVRGAAEVLRVYRGYALACPGAPLWVAAKRDALNLYGAGGDGAGGGNCVAVEVGEEAGDGAAGCGGDAAG